MILNGQKIWRTVANKLECSKQLWKWIIKLLRAGRPGRPASFRTSCAAAVIADCSEQWAHSVLFLHRLSYPEVQQGPCFPSPWTPSSEWNAQSDKAMTHVFRKPWDILLSGEIPGSDTARICRSWDSCIGTMSLSLSLPRGPYDMTFNCNWFLRHMFSYWMHHRIRERQNHSVPCRLSLSPLVPGF